MDELTAAKEAETNGQKVFLARRCAECGDLLFGPIGDNPHRQVQCEEGEHNSRPGVWV